MRTTWMATGLLVITLALAGRAFAGGDSCCACTFCTGPSVCEENVATTMDCDTFCNSKDTCMFHTLVPDVSCVDVGVCPQAQGEPSPVGAPALSGPAGLVLIFILGGMGVSTLRRRSSD